MHLIKASLFSSPATSAAKVAEGGVRGSHLLCGQPQSPGDEEQHREVPKDGRGDEGSLSRQRSGERETLGDVGPVGDVLTSSCTNRDVVVVFFSRRPQVLYDSAQQHEASSDWVRATEKWRACVNETLRQTERCRVQCALASQRLPEDRGVDGVDGVFEKAAGKNTHPTSTRQKQNVAPLLFSSPVQLSLSPCCRASRPV